VYDDRDHTFTSSRDTFTSTCRDRLVASPFDE
jgi:hypothetical protein